MSTLHICESTLIRRQHTVAVAAAAPSISLCTAPLIVSGTRWNYVVFDRIHTVPTVVLSQLEFDVSRNVGHSSKECCGP